MGGEVDSEPALHGYSPTGLRKPEDFRLANGDFSGNVRSGRVSEKERGKREGSGNPEERLEIFFFISGIFIIQPVDLVINFEMG